MGAHTRCAPLEIHVVLLLLGSGVSITLKIIKSMFRYFHLCAVRMTADESRDLFDVIERLSVFLRDEEVSYRICSLQNGLIKNTNLRIILMSVSFE